MQSPPIGQLVKFGDKIAHLNHSIWMTTFM
jgi:hypothetical protein